MLARLGREKFGNLRAVKGSCAIRQCSRATLSSILTRLQAGAYRIWSGPVSVTSFSKLCVRGDSEEGLQEIKEKIDACKQRTVDQYKYSTNSISMSNKG